MFKSRRKLFSLQLLKPLKFNLLLNDLLKIKYPIRSNEFHLKKAINWIKRAHQATKDGGISYGYSIIVGWENSYPETSGYIICTLLDYYERYNDYDCVDVSEEIAEWLCSIQFKNGGFQGDTVEKNKSPSIFNTGQIIFGLLRAYKFFNNQNYLNSAIRAGNFLCSNQEKNGNWIKYSYRGKYQTYNVRTAWALLELYLLTNKEKYKEAAKLNLEWAKSQITKNFWFKNNEVGNSNHPLLHFISYAIRAFLESGIILSDDSLMNISFNAATILLNRYKKIAKNRYLPARFDLNWESKANYSCLTGDAQLAIIWLKIYEIYKNKQFLINAIKLNNFLKSRQIISKRFQEVDGGIKGSDPIWGEYRAYYILNWAVKFFCDSLILENDILKKNDSKSLRL